MADLKQDLLSLNYSSNFDILGMQEADVNLSLPPAVTASATVYGVVTNGTDPVPDATVKLFDSAGLPYQHTLTAADGSYTLDNVPAGTYSISAVQSDYLLSDAVGITLAVGDTTQVNLTLTADPTLALGTIAGVLKVIGLETGETPLGGAKITLLDAVGAPVAATYTVADGEFAFYDVADGVYTLMATAEGYRAVAPVTATILGGSIANVRMSMTMDARTYSGTVSGIIRDQYGNAVAGCFVGLYQAATATTQELLIATTKTNDAGKYLFGGVASGQYLVKAKMDR